ncbi:MAG: hypothetical protein MKZ95_18485 [Pirellulales bacterium]|jgi:hypothetical protein|nr:hypothetical protein [Pirellulales bacterium]|tara:strand:- start:774 stop:983 length:210 start_codon:yes stop_codon:yes gene_type:complete
MDRIKHRHDDINKECRRYSTDLEHRATVHSSWTPSIFAQFSDRLFEVEWSSAGPETDEIRWLTGGASTP